MDENILKKAFQELEWVTLKKHLDGRDMTDATLEIFLGHLRRENSFILRYPDERREQRRQIFIDNLRDYLHARLGTRGSTSLDHQLKILETAERGYRGILKLLEPCEISKLAPDTRVSAYVSRSAHQYRYVTKRLEETFAVKKEIFPQASVLTDDANLLFSSDGAIAGIVQCLTITLLMEAYKNNWFDTARTVILPVFPEVTDAERYKAGATEVLAAYWLRWQRTEERRRFVGGEFKHLVTPNLPKWAPKKAKEITIYTPTEEEFFDYAANERVKDRFGQTFLQMIFQSNPENKATGIENSAALLPDAFISVDEVHSAVLLSEILSYSIADDKETPGGLRLVEWVRGYAVLQQLARNQVSKNPKSDALIFQISYQELLPLLERLGLRNGANARFVASVVLKETSWDLFDCPLIKMANGLLTVFAPALISALPARVVLSTLANLREPLSRKGKAFERDILDFLKAKGLQTETFGFKRGGQEYQYDVVLLWNDYVFIFECKNHSLTNNNPIQAFYFDLELHSNAKQVNRLADALRAYPDVLLQKLGVDVAAKTLIPCVLNSLPFSLPGKLDGAYFTDASALKRFFEERNFHIIKPYEIRKNIKLLHRTAMQSLWAGDKPQPEDLIRQLEHPFQLELMLGHTDLARIAFALGDTEIAVTHEFTRKEMSVESFSDVVGLSAESIREEMTVVAKEVKKLKANKTNKRNAPKRNRRLHR
jgi:hypothetical protein